MTVPTCTGSSQTLLDVTSREVGSWFRPLSIYGQIEVIQTGSGQVLIESTLTNSATRQLAAVTSTTYWYDWASAHNRMRVQVSSLYSGRTIVTVVT